jgi:hypothetical protein
MIIQRQRASANCLPATYSLPFHVPQMLRARPAVTCPRAGKSWVRYLTRFTSLSSSTAESESDLAVKALAVSTDGVSCSIPLTGRPSDLSRRTGTIRLIPWECLQLLLIFAFLPLDFRRFAHAAAHLFSGVDIIVSTGPHVLDLPTYTR